MSEQLSTNQRSFRREQIRQRLSEFSGSRRQGMFGMAELLGVSISLLMLLAVLLSYFYFLVPAQSRRDSQERERARLRTLLQSSDEAIRKDQDTNEIVQRLTASTEEFETGHLPQQALGRMDLYGELNLLMKKNALRNTSGPTYTALEAGGTKTTNRSASTKWQSIYPGIAVAVTVEGQYPNLRNFIRDLENSKQFIIINGVELERASETTSSAAAEGAPGTRGSLISLRLDLATYFQRNLAPDFIPAGGAEK